MARAAYGWVRALLMVFVADAAENTPVVVAERDAADVQAAIAGDGDAYARIVRRYQDTLSGRMARFARDQAGIAELVHDVFVEAYFSLASFRGEAPLEHWLQRIATRVGYRYWKQSRQERSARRDIEAERLVDVRSVPARTSGNDEDAAGELLALMERLGPRDRLVLTLLYLEDRSVAEAAGLAGWSQTMVKVQAFRAERSCGSS